MRASTLGTPVFSVDDRVGGWILLGSASASAACSIRRSDPMDTRRSTRSCGLNEFPGLPLPAKADIESTIVGMRGLNTSISSPAANRQRPSVAST